MLSFAHQPHAPSYYVATAQAWPTCPALEEHIQCDVCVIGGGLAGLSTALSLQEKGLSVVLLEGAQIGFGASGRNGGQVIAGFSCDMTSLRQQVGEQAARSLWEMSLTGVALIEQRVKQHQIDCDWTRGYVQVAEKPRQINDLAQVQQALSQQYGYQDLILWDQAQLQQQLGSQRYLGGLFDPHSGHLHPLNYTLGLARAALQAGVRIYEQTPATQLIEGTQPVVKTERGQVSCAHVVLAANAYGGQLVPQLGRRMMPAGTYMIATEVLGPERATSLIANNMAVCDSNMVLDYYRLSADHRLLFGGKVSYSGRTPANLAQAMRRDMLKVFPQLADIRISHAWGGFCDITQNRAPDFGSIAPNIYYVQGFSGHGLNTTAMAGKVLAELIAGDGKDWAVLSQIPHKDFPGGDWWRTPALVLAMAYFKLRDKW